MEYGICSDINNESVLLSDHELDFLTDANVMIPDDDIDLKIANEGLSKFHKTLNIVILNLIKQRTTFEEPRLQTLSKYNYNGDEIILNLRSSHDFKIAALIGLNKIINKTINEKGCLYMFNWSKLKNNYKLNIISILRLKGELSESDIRSIIIDKGSFTSVLQNFNQALFKNDIHFLDERGFLFLNTHKNLYALTSKGFSLSCVYI